MPRAADHVASIVRQADPDRYVATLYAPEAARPALFALHAFGVEVARIPLLVKEPMAGEIRLQWWRDALSSGEGQTGHPVADALRTAMRDHGLPLATFDRLLEARLFDLYNDPMPDLTALEAYCGETVSVLFQLAAIILDPQAAERAAGAAGHAGCAQGLVAILRDMPLARARARCYLPAEILAAAGLDSAAFLAGEPREAMRAAVQATVALAREHLAAFRRGAEAVSPALRPAFLPVALVAPRLAAIDPETAWERSPRDLSTPSRHWRLFRAAMRGV